MLESEAQILQSCVRPAIYSLQPVLSLPGESRELTSVMGEEPVPGFRQGVKRPTGEQSCDWADATLRCADDGEDSARSLPVTTIVVYPVNGTRPLGLRQARKQFGRLFAFIANEPDP